MYEQEIGEITEYVDNFFIYPQQGKYKDAIGNGRLLAEAICKLALFHKKGQRHNANHSFLLEDARGNSITVIVDGPAYRFYKNNRRRFLMLGDLIAILEDLRIFTDSEVIDAVTTLKNEGNPAHHTGPHIFSEAEFSLCKPAVETLVTWLFVDWLQLDIPSEIQSILGGKPKILRAFQPIQSLLKVGVNRRIFENDLIFFTADEKARIQAMCDELVQHNCVLLLGNPVSGKSVLALSVAKHLRQDGYQTYYYSFKHGTSYDLWDDIRPLFNQKILFIIDDCHLDVGSAAHLYYRTHDIQATACMLFVSRFVSQDVQQSDRFDFNLFEELHERTFTSSISKGQEKAKTIGVIKKHQAFFEKTHGKKYEIGDVDTIVVGSYQNLLVLSFHLDVWEKSGVRLGDIDRTDVLRNIYSKYWKPLSRTQKACLLQYASLYWFEIEFESLLGSPEYEETTRKLLKKGLLLQEKQHFYAFYHSGFSQLLVDAYVVHNPRFKRRYKTVEKLLFENIRQYIENFADDGYPLNMHTICSNLFSYGDLEQIGSRSILAQLLHDKVVKASVVKFYREEIEDTYYLRELFKFLLQSNRDEIAHFADALILNNPAFKSMLLRSSYPLSDYSWFAHFWTSSAN